MAELRTIAIPPHLEAMPEFSEVDRVSDIQMLKLEQAIEDLEADILIQTSTETGIARREKILGITPLDTQSLQLRRDNVMLAWFDVYPYTALDLQRRLDLLCGEDTTEFTIDTDAQEMEVGILYISKERMRAVEEMLERIVPLMITFTISIIYHRYSDYIGIKTHTQLAAYTHTHLKEGEVE